MHFNMICTNCHLEETTSTTGLCWKCIFIPKNKIINNKSKPFVYTLEGNELESIAKGRCF